MMHSEAAAQQHIRLEASRRGVRLFRNNCGACTDNNGRVIRYGLGNDSPQINAVIKSSDLIGITPRMVTPEMVGQVVGVFTSVEVKRPGWTYRGKGREVAQKKWLDMVTDLGGIAQFATCGKELI